MIWFSFFIGGGGWVKILEVIAVEILDILFFQAHIHLIRVPRGSVRGGLYATIDQSIGSISRVA